MSFYNHPYFTQRPVAPHHPHPHTPRHHAQAFPAGFPFAHYPPSPAHHAPPQAPAHHHGLATSYPNDIDAEEAAALAHLQAIQARRQAAKQAIDTERLQKERYEQSILQAIEQQVARELAHREQQQAIRQEIQRKEAEKARHEAILLAHAKAEQARRVAYIQHVQEQERAIAARRHVQQAQQAQQAQLSVQRSREHEARKNATENKQKCAAHCASRARSQQTNEFENMLSAMFGYDVNEHAKAPEVVTPRPVAATTETKSNDIPDEVNDILSHFLGFRLDNDKAKATQPTADVSAPTTSTSKPTEEPKKVEEPQPNTETKSAPSSSNAIPEGINDLLAHFLGLRVDPATADDNKVAEVNSKVPEGLNELLGRFGLEFQPDVVPQAVGEESTQAAPSTAPAAAPTSTPARTPLPQPTTPTESPAVRVQSQDPKTVDKVKAPFTSALGKHANIHPFFREFLENLEVAITDDVKERTQGKQDKGKGVATGEKAQPSVTSVPVAAPSQEAPVAASAQPAESQAAQPDAATETPTSRNAPVESAPTNSASLSTLDSIATQLSTLRDSFTFPAHLSFTAPSTNNTVPPLTFNRQNSPYHAQAHKLLELLLKADGVTSGGDREVRRKRKEVVRSVEEELESLERKRDALWEQVKERRERGEVEDEEEAIGSGSEGSVADHDEHHAEVTEVIESAQVPEVASKGYDVGTLSAPVTEDPTTEKENGVVDESTKVEEKSDEPAQDKNQTVAEENKDVAPKEVDEAEKEDGYELL